MKPWLWFLLTLVLTVHARACIWDAESLSVEKSRSKDLASAILGEPAPVEDPQKLRDRIADLQAHRDETNANWWNNLAGAYLRLNQPAEAVKLLEPVVKQFTNDYGIHANLGTAYHLLGRYAEAEKEIARDLEINPDAHFGLEKYHLALLQYLVRDAKYQFRHVYVDELSAPFWVHQGAWMNFNTDEYVSAMARSYYTNGLSEAEKDLAQITQTNSLKWDTDSFRLLGEISTMDEKPAYRKNWDLLKNTNFEAGVIYMAQMNPKEPAAIEMLGVAALHQRNYHLAITAFEKTIALGSLQTNLLEAKIEDLNQYIKESTASRMNIGGVIFLTIVIVTALFSLLVLLAVAIYRKIRNRGQSKAG